MYWIQSVCKPANPIYSLPHHDKRSATAASAVWSELSYRSLLSQFSTVFHPRHRLWWLIRPQRQQGWWATGWWVNSCNTKLKSDAIFAIFAYSSVAVVFLNYFTKVWISAPVGLFVTKSLSPVFVTLGGFCLKLCLPFLRNKCIVIIAIVTTGMFYQWSETFLKYLLPTSAKGICDDQCYRTVCDTAVSCGVGWELDLLVTSILEGFWHKPDLVALKSCSIFFVLISNFKNISEMMGFNSLSVWSWCSTALLGE